MKNQLSIRLHGEHIGILQQLPSGKMSFQYDKSAKTPISINMPLREQTYNEQICEAFFGNLLPESDLARKQIAQKYKISAHNTFALLKAIGYDCAGAVSCHSMNDPVIPHQSFKLSGMIVSEDQLYKHIQNLPSKPLFMDVEGLRLSLAGVQDKAAVCMIDNQIVFPDDGCPTTHILKPASHHYESLVNNEYYSLKIAKELGLNVPHVELRTLKDTAYLLVERYDRHIQNGFVSRIHQIDFCQALGFPSIRKYQNEGGPSLKDSFDLLKQSMQPAVDRNALAAGVVFNYLIGNMDAHAKNFSLLHSLNNEFKLAPFYDIICTRAYSDLTAKMAMKIGSKYGADEVFPRHWEQFCDTVGYSYPALSRLIQQMANDILKRLHQYKTTENAPILDKMINVIEPHIAETIKRFHV